MDTRASLGGSSHFDAANLQTEIRLGEAEGELGSSPQTDGVQRKLRVSGPVFSLRNYRRSVSWQPQQGRVKKT